MVEPDRGFLLDKPDWKWNPKTVRCVMWTSYSAQHAACLPSSFSCRDNFHKLRRRFCSRPRSIIHSLAVPAQHLRSGTGIQPKPFAAARRPPRRLLTQPAALWLPAQRETFSFFGSELLKESQRRINKKRKKKQSFSSEPPALLLAAGAGRLPDRDSWCVCAPATV